VFELVVHGMDIAHALDISFRPPEPVLAQALDVATKTAIATGHGESVLLALTGRSTLPPDFSVV